jgi:hypothetical protein
MRREVSGGKVDEGMPEGMERHGQRPLQYQRS